MKSILFLVLVAAALTTASSVPFAKSGLPQSMHAVTPCVRGVVYVLFRKGSTVPGRISSKGGEIQSIGASSFDRTISLLGVRKFVPFDAHSDSISRAFGIDRIYALYYSNYMIDPHRALTMLEATGEIKCGSVRYMFPECATPNDPMLGQQYSLTAMNVPQAWSVTTGSDTIILADVDDGFNMSHEDLKNAIRIGYDLVGNISASSGQTFQPDNDPSPDNPSNSHGSHTSGCMAATGNNGLGIAGVAYGCRIMALKAAGNESDQTAGIVAGYEGIHYASTHGARVINCSWGGFQSLTDTALANIFLREANARGALIVAAAANNALNNDAYPEYPCNGPFVVSVGATDQANAAAPYSDYGHTVSLWAPGTAVLSCDYPGASAYSAEDGTSFASPNAAGVAGLIASKYPSWPPQFIARQMIQTVRNVVNPANRQNYWGLIDADSALTVAPWPGLIITKYSVDGIASDSLGLPDQQQDLMVTFQDQVANGTGITAQLLNSVGYTADTTPVTLGNIAERATASADFHIIRSGVYSVGALTVRFFVTDHHRLADTLELAIPLKQIPGFVVELPATVASSIKRVSNSVAWATFGNLFSSGSVQDAAFAQEQAGVWSDTTVFMDGSVAPFDIEALDSLTAWFGTGQSNTGSVVYTNDGGASFTPVDCSSFTPFVDGIHFFDASNGILIGDPKSGRWGIGTTSDGGQTWHPLAKPVTAAGSVAGWNNSVAWVGENGWFGTNSRQIYRTTDGGQTWKSARTATEQNSLSVAFADDAKHGFACFRATTVSGTTSGSDGMMYSNDSGATWDTLKTIPAAGISPASVAFVPGSNIAILTSNKGVFRTTDFGLTWSPIGIPTSYNADGAELSISRGALPSGTNGFVVSLNSVANGIASYSEVIPNDAVVPVQPAGAALDVTVSPNPIEGAARIAFVLPAAERVQIAVFDGLGRKIETMADREFGEGTNEVAFSGTAFSAGVYYLDLRTASGEHQSRSITILP